MKRFEKFIASPYFNTGRNFRPLYQILKKFHPKFDNPNFTAKKILKKLYPGNTNGQKSAVSLRVLESQMAALAEKFLVYDSFETVEDFEFSKKLANVLLKKNLLQHSLKACMTSSEILDNSERGIEFFEKRIQMNETLHTIYSMMKPGEYVNEFIKNNTLYLFASFFDRLSKSALNLVGEERADNIPQPSLMVMRDLINQFDAVAFDNNFEDDEMGTKKFALMNYHLCKTRLNEGDYESFKFAIDFYYKNFDSFRHFYKWAFFLRMHNFANTKALELDYCKYGILAHKMSEFIFAKNIYAHTAGNYLDYRGAMNIFWFKFAFLNSEELSEFMNKCIDIIQTDQQSQMMDYMNAFLFFKKNQFEKTLEMISRLSSSVLYKKNIIYMLKLAALYECGNYDEAIMEIDSYEHYLRKNQTVASRARQRGLDFKHAILTFIKLKTDENYYDKDSVLQKIKSGEIRCHLFSWLNEKADEFSKRQIGYKVKT